MIYRITGFLISIFFATTAAAEMDSDKPCFEYSITPVEYRHTWGGNNPGSEMRADCRPGPACKYTMKCTKWGKSPTEEFGKYLQDFRSAVRLDLNRSFSHQVDLIGDRLDLIARAITDSGQADQLQNELAEIERLKEQIRAIRAVLPPDQDDVNP